MDKKIIINAGWIAIAGATFAIGRMTAKPESVTGPEGAAGKSGSGLSSIITTDPGERPASKTGAAEDEFLSKYLVGEAQLLSKEGMAAAMRDS